MSTTVKEQARFDARLPKEQKQFFEKSLNDDSFKPKPDKSEKSFFEKVKDMFS